MVLKPQDLLVALKVVTTANAKWNQRELSNSIGMSLSEVNAAIGRAIKSGLMIKGDSRNEPPQAVPGAIREFIVHGVRYSFPAEKGPMAKGIPTGVIGAHIEREFMEVRAEDISVWPSPHGNVRGNGIKPLYKSIPELVQKPENMELHVLLALIDLVRQGSARERKIAIDKISKLVPGASFHV